MAGGAGGRVGLAEAVAGAVQGFAACGGKTGEGGVGGARLGGVALQEGGARGGERPGTGGEAAQQRKRAELAVHGSFLDPG